MIGWLQDRLASSTVNVGADGGDLPTRRFALLVVASLTVLAVPPLGVSYSALKISALAASMAGTLFLMDGLVFAQKTHYAGIMLIPTPLLMIGLSRLGARWLAVALGLIVLGAIVQNLVTSRCGINRLLGINSCTCPPE